MPSHASAIHSDRGLVLDVLASRTGLIGDAGSSALGQQCEVGSAGHKTCSLSRPSQLRLRQRQTTSGPRSQSIKTCSNTTANRTSVMAIGQEDISARDAGAASVATVVSQDRLTLQQQQLHSQVVVRSEMCITPRSLSVNPPVTACSSRSSASSSSSDDANSVEGSSSQHEESGFVSAASSVCLEAETPELGPTPVKQPPSHRPKPSALTLPGYEDLPLHDDLVSASPGKPAEVEVVVLADFRPCCHVELKVAQGQYATATFQTGAWLYVRIASRGAEPVREGYVPAEFCNLALLSPGTLDELSNDFDAMGDPFSPPKQLVMFNSLTTTSPLSATAANQVRPMDIADPVRYDVASVQRRTSSGVCSMGSQSSTTAMQRAAAQNSTPSPAPANRRHSYVAQSDTEGYTSRSRSIVAALNVRTRKVSDTSHSSIGESRPRSCSYSSSHRVVESDYETWTSSRDRPIATLQHGGSRAKYDSDCESVVGGGLGTSRRNTLGATEVPQSRSSRSRLVERLRNFRSRGSTLKLTTVDEPAASQQQQQQQQEESRSRPQCQTLPAARSGQMPSESPSAFAGRRAHVVKDKSSFFKKDSPKAQVGYMSDTEVTAGSSKLSKGGKKRSIFSSLRRLNAGSQTDTEDGGGSSRRRWRSLHVTKKEKVQKEAAAEHMVYDIPPMRRQGSLPRLPSEKPAEPLTQSQRQSMVYLPCMAACNFIGRPQLGQVSLKEGQRVFRLLPPGESAKAKRSSQTNWVLVLDPWTKREGVVPQSCLSTMTNMSQSTML